MTEFELSTLVDEAMARLGNGHRELVAVSEVVDLLLDIRLLVDKIAQEQIGGCDARHKISA